MNLKPRRHEEPEINVVSLIDVVLLLVVFFMLSSRFTDEGRMRVQLSGRWTRETREIGAGALFVPIAQPAARLCSLSLLDTYLPATFTASAGTRDTHCCRQGSIPQSPPPGCLARYKCLGRTLRPRPSH